MSNVKIKLGFGVRWVVVVFMVGMVGLVLLDGSGNHRGAEFHGETEMIGDVNMRELSGEFERVVSIMAVGDVMLGREVQRKMVEYGDDAWPFVETGEVLMAADLTVGNLESVVMPGCTQHDNQYMFCARTESVAGLQKAGFDVMSGANNHRDNYGRSAYIDSKKLLASEGIVVADEQDLVIRDEGGLQVGVLGLDDVTRALELGALEEQLASVREEVDLLVVMVHWGIEYVNQPVARQREVALVMAEAGVDVVLGAHPHWVQPVEYVGETLVFWSLGNFVFDQMWSEETRQSVAALIEVKVREEEDKIIEYELLPVRIYDYGQPKWE